MLVVNRYTMKDILKAHRRRMFERRVYTLLEDFFLSWFGGFLIGGLFALAVYATFILHTL